MNTKEKLTAMLNALQNVETKGGSTLILADCMRELAGLIQTMPDLPPKDKTEKGKE